MITTRTRITQLQALASNLVGDGKEPDVFFVTQRGIVQLVTVDFNLAYGAWLSLPRTVESALENRQCGCICSNDPEGDGSTRLVCCDCSEGYQRTWRNRNSA